MTDPINLNPICRVNYSFSKIVNFNVFRNLFDITEKHKIVYFRGARPKDARILLVSSIDNSSLPDFRSLSRWSLRSRDLERSRDLDLRRSRWDREVLSRSLLRERRLVRSRDRDLDRFERSLRSGKNWT